MDAAVASCSDDDGSGWFDGAVTFRGQAVGARRIERGRPGRTKRGVVALVDADQPAFTGWLVRP
jgi:hypothetical protein